MKVSHLLLCLKQNLVDKCLEASVITCLVMIAIAFHLTICCQMFCLVEWRESGENRRNTGEVKEIPMTPVKKMKKIKVQFKVQKYETE